jgi:hypothetical protein
MPFRDAQIVGSLAYIGPDGQPEHVPHGACQLQVGVRSVTVRWGELPNESTSFPINLLDEFVSGGAIVCD